MTYGDGSGTYFDVLTSIDVAAHELDMLFVKNSKLSVPEKEGMNEASDIWGACIEYYAAPGKSTWLIERHRKKSRKPSVTFDE
jgi:Zn-dependent metalloprotease